MARKSQKKPETPGKAAPRRSRSTGKATNSSKPAVASSGASLGAVHNGFFITLEGGEGSGKSTQMHKIAEWLRDQGHQVITTREPGGSPGAEAVRHVLLSGAAENFGTDMEAILFAAARADHVDSVIAPALERGAVVVSDRFFDSTRVYQGVSGRASAELVRKLERVACGNTWPDLTIIIDVKPEEGMKRAEVRRKKDENPDRFEKEALELQQQRRDAYLAIAKAEPGRCVVVSGNGKPETVFARIKKVIEKKMDDRPGETAKSGKPAARRSSKPKLVSHKALTRKKGATKVAEQAT